MEDKSDAFYRRLLILEMDHVITAEEMDPDIKQKTSKEIEYAIYRAIQGLETLYENGRIRESPNSIASVKKARIAADSIYAFLNETVCHQDGSRIDRSRMYQLYEDYCRDNGRTAVGKTNFFAEMERKGYGVSKYQGIFKYKDVAIKSEVGKPESMSLQMRMEGFEPVREKDVSPFQTA